MGHAHIRERVIFDGNKGWCWKGETYRLVCGVWLAEGRNGELISNWLTGADKEPAGDNCTAVSVSYDGGKTWSEPRMMVPPAENPGSAWIFGVKDKLVSLNARWPLEDKYTVWHYARTESTDLGKTWTEEVPIHLIDRDGMSASFSQLIRCSDGRYLFSGTTFQKRAHPLQGNVEKLAMAKTEEEAARVEPHVQGDSNPHIFGRVRIGSAVFETNEELSRFHMLGGVANRPLGLLEPTVVELKDGRLVMLMRAEWGGYLWRTESRDGGHTWCDAYQTDIPNPTSMAMLIRIPDGRIVLIHNNCGGVVGKRAKREPLSIWVSDDEMETWYIKEDVATGGDLAYPHPMVLKDGRVVFVYDFNRREARFVEILLD